MKENIFSKESEDNFKEMMELYEKGDRSFLENIIKNEKAVTEIPTQPLIIKTKIAKFKHKSKYHK